MMLTLKDAVQRLLHRRPRPASPAPGPVGPESARPRTQMDLLIVCAAIAMVATQELLQLLLLEVHGFTGQLFTLQVLTHLAQIVLILSVAFIWLRASHKSAELLDAGARRVSELETEFQGLQARQETVARTLERVVAEHDEERRLLGYDIHNGLAQIVVSAKQHLDTFEDLWRSGTPGADAELAKALDRLGRAVVETRLVLAALRPGSLESLGFAAAIRGLVDETAAGTGLKVTLSSAMGDTLLPGPVETAIYRIVQEALANAAKHARATEVAVTLRLGEECLEVEVADSGVGFSVAPEQAALGGVGILGMQERARLVGGVCWIESEPEAGTRVRARFPLGAERD